MFNQFQDWRVIAEDMGILGEGGWGGGLGEITPMQFADSDDRHIWKFLKFECIWKQLHRNFYTFSSFYFLQINWRFHASLEALERFVESNNVKNLTIIVWNEGE